MRNILLCILVMFISCNTIEKSETKTSKSFFENSNISNRFRGVDSVKQMNDLWLFFNSIGEPEFLNSNNYDFYIVYSMRRWHEPLKVFSISSLNDQITYRKIELNNFTSKLIRTKDGSHIQWSSSLSSSSGSFSRINVKPYQDIMNFAVNSMNKDTSFYYDEDVSQTYYYDGRNYFFLTKDNLAISLIDSINSVFRVDSLNQFE